MFLIFLWMQFWFVIEVVKLCHVLKGIINYPYILSDNDTSTNIYSELLSFWTLSIIQYSKKLELAISYLLKAVMSSIGNS
jgi:hypothetical protein